MAKVWKLINVLWTEPFNEFVLKVYTRCFEVLYIRLMLEIEISRGPCTEYKKDKKKQCAIPMIS